VPSGIADRANCITSKSHHCKMQDTQREKLLYIFDFIEFNNQLRLGMPAASVPL
jgi:hypothetical protein